MYDIERENLMTDFFKENLSRESIHENRKKYFENFAHAIATLTKQRVDELTTKFGEDKIDIHSENVIQSENLQLKYNRRMKMACVGAKKLIEFFKYEKNIDERLEDYKEIQSKHESEEKVIRHQKIAIEESKVKIRELTEALENVEYFHLTKVNEMKSEKIFLQKIFHELNEQMKSESQKDQKKIELLVTLGRRTQRIFDRKLEKLTKILNIVNLVEKHEKISDLEFDVKIDGNLVNFLREKLMWKTGNVQAENVILKNEMKYLTEKNKEIAGKIVQLNNQEKIYGNCESLGFDQQNFNPSGDSIPIQFANLLPQIADTVKQLRRNNK